jgi:8-oxo-dGTP pyrophosphatase MutT (NUDIX family)
MSDAEAHVPLATGPLGMELLSFRVAPEETRFDDSPVGYALVALWHGDRVLMVLERGRRCWELPGGGIDAGETPREAAARELQEETGQRVPAEELCFAGFARTALPDRRVMYGALYTARIDAPAPFTPNDEISAIHWRAEDDPLPEEGALQTVDAYLIARCRP